VVVVEETLAGQLAPQLLEGFLQCALAGHFQRLHLDLEVAALFVERDLALGVQQHPVFGRKREPFGLPAPHHAADLCVVVLELKIAVPGGRAREINQLALHAHIAHAVFNEVAQPARQVAYREHPCAARFVSRFGEERGHRKAKLRKRACFRKVSESEEVGKPCGKVAGRRSEVAHSIRGYNFFCHPVGFEQVRRSDSRP